MTTYTGAFRANFTDDGLAMLHKMAEEASRRVREALDAEIEATVAAAHEAGLDVAVSEPEADEAGAVSVSYYFLEPGEPLDLPPGRRWRVIHCGTRAP